LSVLGGLELATINLCTKFDPTLTHYKDMKCDKNAKMGGLESYGVTQGHQQHKHLI